MHSFWKKIYVDFCTVTISAASYLFLSFFVACLVLVMAAFLEELFGKFTSILSFPKVVLHIVMNLSHTQALLLASKLITSWIYLQTQFCISTSNLFPMNLTQSMMLSSHLYFWSPPHRTKLSLSLHSL